MTFGRTHSIAVDAFGRNPAAAATLYSLVYPEYQGSISTIQISNQQAQQHLAQSK
jgi:hypothetical protein